MKRIILLLALGACSRSSDRGVANADPSPTGPPGCPHVQLKAPDSVPAGEPAAVEADVIGRAEGATLVWTTSTGTITNGQGTDKITVDTAGLEGKSVITTVELRGLRTECLNRTAQFTTLVGPSA